MTNFAERSALYENNFAPGFKNLVLGDHARRSRNFWYGIACPFLDKLDNLNIPSQKISIFERGLASVSPFGIMTATKQVLIESLRLKDEKLSGIVSDEIVLQTIGLWSSTLSELDIETLNEHNNVTDLGNNDRLYGGSHSLIVANDCEFTFVGNPEEQVIPIPNFYDKPCRALDLIKEQLVTRYGLTDKETELALGDMAGKPGAIVHLRQERTNGLTSFTLRTGDLSATKVVSFGANGYYRVPSENESKKIRVVFESPDKLPVYYRQNDGQTAFKQITAKNLGIDVQLSETETSNLYKLSISNENFSRLLDSASFLSLGSKKSYHSIGFN